MRVSAFDLAFTFCDKYAQPGSVDAPEQRAAVLHRVYERLADGWLAEDLMAVFARGPKGFRPKAGNLVVPTLMYYHNQLRIFPGPPKLSVDYNTGKIEKVSEPYFLEMRASYTVEDAVAYYLAQFKLTPADVSLPKYLGTFRHLLKSYAIDLFLFMIDCCVNNRVGDDAGSPVDPIVLNEYERPARDAMNAKITEERTRGVEAVVPRKRILVGRGGSGGSEGTGGIPA